ncbi:cytidyltransferase domain protein [Dictyocaulus viviparus]|uniref:ethanolamine-phosphate cytidylyltransferase n=1 Tax=Dictyocaulus viviparus TaxID=29172 RepID=A0A0D8X8Q4_DICVI|nr:cytidyltransferase domain protein [Dictyocaulus viviparus]
MITIRERHIGDYQIYFLFEYVMEAPDGGPKGDRIWCDGCYDLVHFGHANQFRQAKQFGKKLIVGVHNDEEITLHKGPPLFNQEERYRMVKGIKWVDEVVENAPYITTVETLDRYNCDFCVHGDDITLTYDGKDTYEEVKKAKRYRTCKRTNGVSTTDIVARMLFVTKCHHVSEENMDQHRERARTLSTDSVAQSPWTRVSRFVATTQTIVEFAEGRPPKPTDKIVYVCGAFDLFHIGHLSFLEEAAKLGDYLIVVNEYKGRNYPIMSLHERVLSVLAFKPVNEVVIGAPYSISDEIIDQFNISVSELVICSFKLMKKICVIIFKIVCQGTRVPHHNYFGFDPYEPAKKRGIYREVDSKTDMTNEKIIQRVVKHSPIFPYNSANICAREMFVTVNTIIPQGKNGELTVYFHLHITTS